MRARVSAVLLVASMAAPARAQDIEAPLGDERPPEATLLDEVEADRPAEPGRVTVSAGATFVGQYISRGIAFSDKPSLQPYLSVRVALPELAGGIVTDAGLFAGTWNSIQFTEPGLGQPSSGDLAGWYEADVYAGAAVELNDRWIVSAAYYRYESPGQSFRAYDDFELIVRFDDGEAWADLVPLPDFTLSPTLRLVQESNRPGRPDALYVQPSLTPSFSLSDAERPVRLSIPLVVGLSDEYYDGIDGRQQTFGYFRTGLIFAANPFGGQASALELNGGFDLWLLNERVANGLDNAELVGRAGVSWSF
ncbi:hypothetical protein [Sphingosinithalassobacter sp. CS137]|uniref:hypothetical protein n=1 Tax=Sphingosinithalassobacter sp. CS137 TaxID=2762748 RepID=UPI00165E91D6|nr:hypothetical protein [Sphingosinithalassobacter sp. CS137]